MLNAYVVVNCFYHTPLYRSGENLANLCKIRTKICIYSLLLHINFTIIIIIKFVGAECAECRACRTEPCTRAARRKVRRDALNDLDDGAGQTPACRADART